MNECIKVSEKLNEHVGAINTQLQQNNTTTEAMHEDVKQIKEHFACDKAPELRDGETPQQFIQRNRDFQHLSRKNTKLALEQEAARRAEKKHNAQAAVEHDAMRAEGMVQKVAGELATLAAVDAKKAEVAAYTRTLKAREKQLKKEDKKAAKAAKAAAEAEDASAASASD